jgi:hypothetical protein
MIEYHNNIEYISRYDPLDIKISSGGVVSGEQYFRFGDMPDVLVEMHVYTTTNQYIGSVYNVPNVEFNTVDGKRTFSIDLQDTLVNEGFPSGDYNIIFTFLKPLISQSGTWYVQQISTSRTEIRIGANQNYTFAMSQSDFSELIANVKQTYPYSRLVLNFGKNQIALCINQVVSGNAIIFKTYKPLSDNIIEKMTVVPMVELANSIGTTITLVSNVSVESPIRVLGAPNTNVVVNKRVESETSYKSWNDLLTTNAQTSKDLIGHYLSSSKWETTVNVDYSNFSNFVFFGSAEERVKNFKYKLGLLETYSSSISSLTSSVAVDAGQVTASIGYFQNLQKRVINGFDGYEQWLYFESGSTYSSSLGFGEVTQSTWLKVSGASVPYTINGQVKTDSAAGETWYNNEIVNAQDFDRSNPYILTNTVPLHIVEDENNASYLLFLEMIGQHFDNLWLYIKNFNQKYDLQHKLNEGTPKDVIWSTLKTFGLDLTNSNDVTSLWRYAFGMDETGSFGTNTYNMSYEDATKEIWKRLLNNLPYLLKSKGTERGIRALITCYGIPSTILKIKEYGGPEPEFSTDTTKQIQDVFSYKLGFDGTAKVSSSWSGFGGANRPDSIELRFKTPTVQTSTLFQIGNDSGTSNYLTVAISGSSSLYDVVGGVLSFTVTSGTISRTVSTSEIPIFNNGYWSVLLKRTPANNSVAEDHTYYLFAKQVDFDKITHEVSTNLFLSSSNANSQSLIGIWNSGSQLVVGSNLIGGNMYSGSIQEFRAWRNSLNESVFDNHVLAPTAYNGNYYTSSYYDLLLRWKFDQTSLYSSGGFSNLILDTNPNKAVITNGFWSGATSASLFDYQTERNIFNSPNVGSRRWQSNKIRVDNSTYAFDALSHEKRVTRSALDTAPIDLSKLGVYLSPQDVVNEDIIRTYPDFNIDEFIGSPTTWYGSSYPDLITARNVYVNKYSTVPNIFTYMNVLSYFDKSLFDQIRKMVPARAALHTGFLIEPNVLERSKTFFIRKPFDSGYFTNSASLDLHTQISESAESNDIDAIFEDYTVLDIMANSLTVDATESLHVLPDTSVYSIPTIYYSSSISNQITTAKSSSFSWEVTGTLVYPVDDYWFDSGSFTPVLNSSGAVVGYSGSHNIFHDDYTTGRRNLFFNGCLQTSDTTTDKKPPVEVFISVGNKLVVVDASEEKPRLKVE